MAMQWIAIQKQNTWNTIAKSQNNYVVWKKPDKKEHIS